MENIRNFAKKHLDFLRPVFAPLSKTRKTIINKIIIGEASKKQQHALEILKGKEKIRCVYFALFESVWKYDSVFKLMLQHQRFDPIILVCPIVNYGKESMIRQMEEAYQAYRMKGYPVIKAYNEESDSYIDVRKELKPDLIVYTNPYKGLIDGRYYITKYIDILSFYVHYGYNSVTEWDFLYKQQLTNVVWRYYVESPLHLGYVKDHSYNKGQNCVVTGYPGVEFFMDKNYKAKDNPWKIKAKEVKRIIWAPHHSIESSGVIKFSTFLRYADYMLDMAKCFNGQAQFAFKPHPVLKDKLYKYWGKEKTDNYYEQWESLPNTILAEGEYLDLFLTSDAMVHDSGSFLIEYLYVRKPVMRLMNGDNMEKTLNTFAKKCLDVYYKGSNEDDIELFVKNVINNVDPLCESREKHYSEYLQPYNGKLPSQNIVDDILDSIDNQVLYRN